jgi:hypothetical protein
MNIIIVSIICFTICELARIAVSYFKRDNVERLEKELKRKNKKIESHRKRIKELHRDTLDGLKKLQRSYAWVVCYSDSADEIFKSAHDAVKYVAETYNWEDAEFDGQPVELQQSEIDSEHFEWSDEFYVWSSPRDLTRRVTLRALPFRL